MNMLILPLGFRPPTVPLARATVFPFGQRTPGGGARHTKIARDRISGFDGLSGDSRNHLQRRGDDTLGVEPLPLQSLPAETLVEGNWWNGVLG